MELENIKRNTTWNDASASINSNFMKVRQAILALQSGGGGLGETELEEYLTSQGYTKEEWVLAQNALLEERIENLEQEGGAVNVEGSAFISVSQDGVISLDVDAQGGLGRTEQGLGIVSIPSELLKDIKIDVDSSMSDTSENAVANKVIKKYVDERAEQAYEQANEYTDEEVAHIEGVLNARIDSLEGGKVYNIYYNESNNLSDEQLEANGKAYAALMSEEKAAFYLVQEGNVYSRLIVSTTMKSASTEAIAVEAHIILPIGNKTMLGTTAINLYSDGHISMTVVQTEIPNMEEVWQEIDKKQGILVDGQNIKTINGQSILGEGDIEIQGSGNVSIEVDAELSESSENAVSNKAVTEALAETEEVTAAALNELNKRFEEYATKEELEDALADVSIEVDSAMSETSENAVSNKVIKKYVDDADKSVKEYVDDADNALAKRINALEQNSGGGASVEVDAELSESSTNAVANKAVTMAIVEDEEVISVALNQMNTRFDNYVPLDALATEIQNAKDVINASIIDNEEVAAAALVDLDKRLKDILTILGNAGLIS